MHPDKLPLRQRRILALSILLGMLVIVYLMLGVPYTLLLGSYDERLRKLDDRMIAYRAIIRDGEVARRHQRQLERIESANGYYLATTRPALASAELQRRVKTVIEQNGGTVVSSQMLGERDEQGLGQVVLRVQMRCGVEALSKVLYALEGGSPVAMLDNVLIGARPGGSTRINSPQAMLDVRFDVAGFLRPAIHAESDTGE